MRGQGTVKWSDASKASVHSTPVGETFLFAFRLSNETVTSRWTKAQPSEFEVTKDPKGFRAANVTAL